MFLFPIGSKLHFAGFVDKCIKSEAHNKSSKCFAGRSYILIRGTIPTDKNISMETVIKYLHFSIKKSWVLFTKKQTKLSSIPNYFQPNADKLDAAVNECKKIHIEAKKKARGLAPGDATPNSRPVSPHVDSPNTVVKKLKAEADRHSDSSAG